MKTIRDQRNILFLICFISACGAIAKQDGKAMNHDGVKHHTRAISSTIQTEDGDIFDCIDIKSQPAFDHPLLKNHSIQMEPSSYPIEVGGNSTLPDTKLHTSISSVSCPSGTIPMWRSDNYRSMVNLSELTQKIYRRNTVQSEIISSLAGLRRGKDIYGTSVSISVYNPDVYGTEDKSAGLTTIISGYSFDRPHTNAVGAGWFVWTSSAGDRRARFHIFYNNCYDLQCPGFVQTNPAITLGGTLSPVSRYGGPQAQLDIFIYQDDKSNWWVKFGAEGTVIGYWPRELIGHLKAKGTIGYWGGFVEGPTIKYKPPPMGSGHPASEGWGKAAYVKSIKIVDRHHNLVTPRSCEFQVVVGNPKCYSVANKTNGDDGVSAY
uniref:Uncharacterized protein n=1 Tax=Avena sativa TaxID=4498 RepID=A0ACD5YGR2_AVESA